jgi:hypothetical protein
MEKKLLVIIVLVVIASLSIAGCTSSTSSNQAAGNISQATSTTASTSTSASASITPSATPSATPSPSIVPTASPTPTPTPTPSPAPVYTVTVTGPTPWLSSIYDNYTHSYPARGYEWTATVYLNGQPIPTNQISWSVNGAPTSYATGNLLTLDANGMDIVGIYSHSVNIITATYTGVASMPSGSTTYANPLPTTS